MNSELRKGFTLIEVLIYIALLAVMLLGMVQLTASVLDLRGRVQNAKVLEENLRHALTRITAQVRHADDITLPLAGAADTLALTMLDPALDPTTFTVDGGAITIRQGATAPAIPLTSSEIEVTSLTFSRIAATPPAVRIDIAGQLRSAAGPYQSRLSVGTTAVIRR